MFHLDKTLLSTNT